MRVLWMVALGIYLAGGTAEVRADELPIVDTHIHYSENSWSLYSPSAVLQLLDQAGIVRAFVSSTPDEGTVRLYEAAPTRVVPVLRPYRDRAALGSWYGDASVVPYLERRLDRGIHRGIGEFHLSGDEARSPVVRQVVALAARHRLFLHCHCDVGALEILLALEPGPDVLWAHAGMSAGAEEVGRLLDDHPRLTVELALRSDVAPAGRLDPAWRVLFVRHADRIMVGTDTWVPSRWKELVAVQAATRNWLQTLPSDVASRIASGNAGRLAADGR